MVPLFEGSSRRIQKFDRTYSSTPKISLVKIGFMRLEPYLYFTLEWWKVFRSMFGWHSFNQWSKIACCHRFKIIFWVKIKDKISVNCIFTYRTFLIQPLKPILSIQLNQTTCNNYQTTHFNSKNDPRINLKIILKYTNWANIESQLFFDVVIMTYSL